MPRPPAPLDHTPAAPANRRPRAVVVWALLVSLMSLLEVGGGTPARAEKHTTPMTIPGGGPKLPDELFLANVPARPSVFAAVNGSGYLLTDPAVAENAVRSYDSEKTGSDQKTKTQPLANASKASVGDWDGDGRHEVLLLDASGRLQLLDDASTGFVTIAQTSGVTAAAFAPTAWTGQQEIVVARGGALTRYPHAKALPTEGKHVFEPRWAKGTTTLVDHARGVSKVTDLRAVTDSRSHVSTPTEIVATYLTGDGNRARSRIIRLDAHGFVGQGVTMAEVAGSAFVDAAGVADGNPSRYDISISAVGSRPGTAQSKRGIWQQERTSAFSGEAAWREVTAQPLGCVGDGQASLASAVLPHAGEPRLVVACPMAHDKERLEVRLSFSVSDMRQTSVAFPATSTERPAVALVAQIYGHAEKAAGFHDELDLVGAAVAVEGSSRQVRGGALSWAISNVGSPANLNLGNVKSRKDDFRFGEAVRGEVLPFAFTAPNTGRITIRAERERVRECEKNNHRACEYVEMQPHPIALFQAPPLVAGLDQRWVNPTFSLSKSKGETTERSLSYTVTSAIGLSLEVPTVVELEMTATLEAQIGRSEAVGKTYTIRSDWAGTHDDHTVIYTEDTMWKAYYKITEASDGFGIGKVQQLLLPRESIIVQSTVTRFLQHPRVQQNAKARELFARAFVGTIGNPGTYPRMTGRVEDIAGEMGAVNCLNRDREPLKGGPVVAKPHAVAMGVADGAADQATVALTASKEQTDSWELSIGLEAKLGAGAFSQALGYSRAVGGAFTVSAASDVAAAASVAHIRQTAEQLGKKETYNWRLYLCKRVIGGWPVWVAGFHTSGYEGRGSYLSPEVNPAGPSHNADVSTTPTLSWTASGTLRSFKVELKSLESSYRRDFEEFFDPGTAATYRPSSPGSFRQAIPAKDKLTSGEQYAWRVTAVGVTGATSQSEWQSFWAWNAPTAAPVVYDPLVNPDGSLTIDWAPPADAKRWTYDVRIENSAGTPIASFVGVPGTRIRTQPLKPDETYRIRVNGRNPLGIGPAGEKTVTVRCRFGVPALPELGCVVSNLLSGRQQPTQR